MVAKKIRSDAWGSHLDGWSGVLVDDEEGKPIWECEHDHPDDIEAGFCALDKLIESQVESDDDEAVDACDCECDCCSGERYG